MKPELCQGHFVGFPAFPVSIIMRHCVNLVGIGIGSKVRVVDFTVEAKRFAWAGKRKKEEKKKRRKEEKKKRRKEENKKKKLKKKKKEKMLALALALEARCEWWISR